MAGMPIWDSKFKFESKSAGYLFAIIPGWSVLAESEKVLGVMPLRGSDRRGQRPQATGFGRPKQ